MEPHPRVTGLPFGDAAAHGSDGACKFVPEYWRRRNVGVKDLFYVGATDPASRNFDEHFAVGHFRDRDLLDADDSLFAVHTRVHGLGNGTKRLHGFQGRAGAAHVAETSLDATARGL